ncbi:MAG: hypothetical protein H7235_11495, partial [Bdellovibrionaceae bacterium]|nr:hypothetical protein [Pseudobdellovibrionaceae bacterium]
MSSKFLLWISVFYLVTAQVGSASENLISQNENKSCQQIVEGFCDSLWSPSKLGNLDIKIGKSIWPLRFGTTKNDISQTRYIFLQALKRNMQKLPVDIQQAFQKTHFQRKLNLFLRRKRPDQQNTSDQPRPEYLHGILDDLEDSIKLVAWLRTEAQHPGFLQLAHHQVSSEVRRLKDKNFDQVRSELFVAVWRTEKRWQDVQEMFTKIREEYVNLIKDDQEISSTLKKEMLADLQSLKLVIPGENPAHVNSPKWHNCGIDMENAAYRLSNHEITICAGEFNSASPLLTIAHEVGHSFSLARRLQNYLSSSDYGKNILNLWKRSSEGKNFSCLEWNQFKKDFTSHTSTLPAYNYEHVEVLETYIKSKLLPIPTGSALNALAERLSKATLRSEINNHSLEHLIKPEEILLDGTTVKNDRYLKPTLNFGPWPNPNVALFQHDLQFELFFSAEYGCHLEMKTSSADALRLSIETARLMVQQSWAL